VEENKMANEYLAKCGDCQRQYEEHGVIGANRVEVLDLLESELIEEEGKLTPRGTICSAFQTVCEKCDHEDNTVVKRAEWLRKEISAELDNMGER